MRKTGPGLSRSLYPFRGRNRYENRHSLQNWWLRKTWRTVPLFICGCCLWPLWSGLVIYQTCSEMLSSLTLSCFLLRTQQPSGIWRTCSTSMSYCHSMERDKERWTQGLKCPSVTRNTTVQCWAEMDSLGLLTVYWDTTCNCSLYGTSKLHSRAFCILTLFFLIVSFPFSFLFGKHKTVQIWEFFSLKSSSNTWNLVFLLFFLLPLEFWFLRNAGGVGCGILLG